MIKLLRYNKEVWQNMVINKNVPAKEILEFRDKREWGIHHTPSNLVKSISVEAAELLELYQWGDDASNIERVKEELADVLIYSITLAERLELDISEIILEKIKKNGIKYPEK